MAEEIIEETIETIISEEDAKILNEKKEEDLTDIEKANKKLYARVKSEQADKKTLKEEVATLNAKIKELELKGKPTEELKKEKEVIEQKLDPIEFAKQVRSLSNLSDDEIAYAQILAKGMEKTVEEVITTEQFKTWSAAKKTEDETKKSALDTSNRYKGKDKEDPTEKKWTENLPQRYK